MSERKIPLLLQQGIDPKMNRLLACLPGSELEALLPHFEPVSLAHGDTGLTDYTRGHIKITDRRGLEAASCECYSKFKDEYEHLFSG